MTSVEKVLKALKDKNIAVSRMERDLEFGNGYIRQLKKGTMPIERLAAISSYLDVPINDLMSDGQPHLLEMKNAATPKDDGLSEAELELVKLFRVFSEDEKTRILEYVRTVLQISSAVCSAQSRSVQIWKNDGCVWHYLE